MVTSLILVIIGVIALAVGSVLGYFVRQTIAKKQIGSIEARLEKMTEEAKREAKEMVIRAKDKSIQILEETKREQKEREQQIVRMEDRLERREQSLDSRAQELEKKYVELSEKAQKVKEIKDQLSQIQEKKTGELERVAKMTQDEARDELLKQTEKEQEEVLLKQIQKLEKEGKEELEKRARNILVLSMQRYAASQAAEITTSTVNLPSDDLN